MTENIDSAVAYTLLESLGRLPASWDKDCTYAFEHENTFYMVIYFASRAEGRFILYTIEDYKSGGRELGEILCSLQNLEVSREHEAVVERALREVNARMAAGNTGALFFDAH